ncbi:fungal specific transcription factor [Colletotrichum kahawae]|uniref:Fungal specific transcription factor n=1 Tax=Colletotrichum kahawae TaxID=34407 RepID=A0AAD9YPP1_COLKA|nr:fungal specific transcription factor [Colletotrichum kahawae]
MESPQRQILHPTCARMRKVRCDGQMPRCGPCEQADVDCLIVGVSSSSPHNRSYVESLQERVRELQKQEQEVKALLESKHREGGRPMAAEDLTHSNHGMKNDWPDASPIGIGASTNEHGSLTSYSQKSRPR